MKGLYLDGWEALPGGRGALVRGQRDAFGCQQAKTLSTGLCVGGGLVLAIRGESGGISPAVMFSRIPYGQLGVTGNNSWLSLVELELIVCLVSAAAVPCCAAASAAHWLFSALEMLCARAAVIAVVSSFPLCIVCSLNVFLVFDHGSLLLIRLLGAAFINVTDGAALSPLWLCFFGLFIIQIA